MEIMLGGAANAVQLSPLFHYAKSRQQIDDPFEATSVATAMVAAQISGVCRYDLHPVGPSGGVSAPMTVQQARVRPNVAANLDGMSRRLAAWDDESVGTFEPVMSGDRRAKWRTAIRAGRPVVFGFRHFQGYANIDATGVIGGPTNSVGTDGRGHCVVAIGFDDNAPRRPSFRVQDSRGLNWGDQGQWWLPSEIVERDDIVGEAYVINAIRQAPEYA